MSRRTPIYITDSDTEEEPMEDSYDGIPTVVSEGVYPPPVPRDTSDGSIATPPLPSTDPATYMLGSISLSRRHLIGEPSYRPTPRRTPVSCVRDFPVGPSSSRGKEPMTEEREIHCVQQAPRPRVPHLDWMPRILRHWRTIESIPSTHETGESSHAPASLHLTEEPLELTVPTVVAVVRTLLGFHFGTQDTIRAMRSDASRLDDDVLAIYGRIATSEMHIEVDRESADATRARLIRLEGRLEAVGAAVGLCVLMAAVRVFVGWSLPYFF